MVTVVLNVEIDPDNATANVINNALENSAVASGMDSGGGLVTDLSDDPADGTSDDDPTRVSVADLSVTKEILSTIAAASGVTSNYDITYTLRITNTGTETLSQLSLVDDLSGQFGGALVRVVGLSVSNIDATSAPAANLAFNGIGITDMLSGSVTDSLAPGQSFSVTLVVELDPDHPSATYNANDELENIAAGGAMGVAGSITRLSDDPNDLTDNDTDLDGQPNDPTTLAIGDLQAIKTAGTPVPSVTFPGASGTVGNFVVPYTITTSNTGNDIVDSFSIVEDLASQFAGGFVSVIGSPTITVVNTSGNSLVVANPSLFDGNVETDLLDASVSQLGIGDSVTIEFDVEVDPDNATAALVGGAFENTAVASGTDSSGGLVSDDSDDPADPTSDDDPTRVFISGLAITKEVSATSVAASGTTGNYDVTYTFTITNTGGETLNNLSLVDDLDTQFGGAFVRVVSVNVVNVDATSTPNVNAGYDGTAGSDMLNGATGDALAPQQSFSSS